MSGLVPGRRGCDQNEFWPRGSRCPQSGCRRGSTRRASIRRPAISGRPSARREAEAGACGNILYGASRACASSHAPLIPGRGETPRKATRFLGCPPAGDGDAGAAARHDITEQVTRRDMGRTGRDPWRMGPAYYCNPGRVVVRRAAMPRLVRGKQSEPSICGAEDRHACSCALDPRAASLLAMTVSSTAGRPQAGGERKSARRCGFGVPNRNTLL